MTFKTITVQVQPGVVRVTTKNYIGLPPSEAANIGDVLTVVGHNPEARAWRPSSGGGGSSGDVVTRIASENLSGHRVVYADSPNTVAYASASDYGQARRIVGLTKGAASLGDNVDIQFQNIINEPGWSWVEGKDVYLGENGFITQTVPVSGNIVQVGSAVSATAMQLGFNFIATRT
jgi:hypothetical protein